MDTLTIFTIAGVVLVGLVAYLQYQVSILAEQCKSLWIQLYILSGAVAQKIEELKEENDKK